MEYTFKELRKAAKLNIAGDEIRLSVVGNVATQFLATSGCGYAKLSGINLNVLDCDYNQIEAQLMDPNSECFSHNPDYIMLWLASEKLYEDFLQLDFEGREKFADDCIERLEQFCTLIRKNGKAKIIIPNFVELDDKAVGQFSAKTASTFIYQIRKQNYLLQQMASVGKDIYIVDILALQNRYGLNELKDDALYYNAKMVFAMNALPKVSKAVVDIIKSTRGMIKKCIILDLDNTLWGGVVGDDGPFGIEIGELGRGHAFTVFQLWLKQLKEYGIILAVCSKNDEDKAKEPFLVNSEMVLKTEDFSVFVANWNDKASNIKMIQEILNIGMDSMVFIDDNPFERNQVREAIPEITVPELPEDPANYLAFLQELNLFDTVSISRESSTRTAQYQQEFERRKTEISFESIDEYLESLDMVGEAKSFSPDKYARIAELTQRSNQFNLRTIRYTEEQIAQIADDSNYSTIYFTLRDKFGDSGLVSVVIMDRINEDELFISEWLMSCRVLKRGMEDYIMNSIFERAQELGAKKVSAEYIPTRKNGMVQNIYRDYGFRTIEENKYEMMVADYNAKKVFIK